MTSMLEKAPSEDAIAGARWLVEHCAAVSPAERVLVIASTDTREIGPIVADECRNTGAATVEKVMSELKIHGGEPPPDIGAAMSQSDVIFCLSKMSLAHSQARRAATDRGARFLSLPDYSIEQLASQSLKVDFAALSAEAGTLGDRLEAAEWVRITSALGTDLKFRVAGRAANRCPGIVRAAGMLGSPPDAETNIAPIEGSAEGTAVIDGSVPCRQIGLLKAPIKLHFEAGSVASVSGDTETAAIAEGMFEEAGPKSRVLGEFGIGLNPKAELCGSMLQDEGCRGTIHLGIGSNITIGGRNAVPFHVDFVMREPTVHLDGKLLIDRGRIV